MLPFFYLTLERACLLRPYTRLLYVCASILGVRGAGGRRSFRGHSLPSLSQSDSSGGGVCVCESAVLVVVVVVVPPHIVAVAVAVVRASVDRQLS